MTRKTFYESVLGIKDPNALDKLIRSSKWLYAKKGDTIVQINEVQKDLLFLVEGILRGYLWDTEGREYTDCFVYQCGTPMISCSDPKSPSPIQIEALKDCVILTLPMAVIDELLLESLEINHLYLAMLSAALQHHWAVKMVSFRYSAGEKYRWFLEEYPDLAVKVPQKYIASYLNMTPETLSDEKRKLKQLRETDVSAGQE